MKVLIWTISEHGHLTRCESCFERALFNQEPTYRLSTRVQSKSYTEPSSFSSLFNLPYSKDIHYFSQARYIAHSSTQCRKLYVLKSIDVVQGSENYHWGNK